MVAGKLAAATQAGADANAKAGEVADEVLTSLRTVTSMNAEEKEFKRYSTVLEAVCEVYML
jgi:hypothetical protein